MRKLQILCCYVLLSVLCYCPAFGQKPEPVVKQGVVRIKVTDELAAALGNAPRTRSSGVKTGLNQLDDINRQVKAVRMQRVFPYSPKNEERMKKHGLDLWYDVKYDNAIAPQNAANLYRAINGISHAEAIRILKDDRPKIVAADESAFSARAAAPFNDPLLPKQWHYQNDGTTSGAIVGSDINLYEAWKITTGSPNVTVAIIDGGIDYKHRDLASNMWTNKAELNGLPGVDDDGNGYIDDIYGYNFVTSKPEIYPHNHGTHVAGTVGAVNNNGIGLSGVAGGSGKGDGIRMMSCQIFDDRTKDAGDFAASLVYAANNGAVIAQCSWGWNLPDYYEQAVLDAIGYFIAEAGHDADSPMTGGICIFAAGNNGTEGDYYPGAIPSVVAVGSMQNNFKVAPYSNFGTWIDIMAPGGVTETIGETGVYSTIPNDGYGYMQGTSQACPHVAGVAALILSKYGNKSYTPEQLRNRLVTAVHDIYPANPEYIGKLGEGYIDALLALKEDQGKAPGAVGDFELYPSQVDIAAEWTIPSDEDDGFIQKHVIYWSDREFNAQSDLSGLNTYDADTKFKVSGDKVNIDIPGFKAETKYWMAIKAFDRWGNQSALSPVKETQTNKGPEAQISKKSMSLTLNVATTDSVKDMLKMSNVAEGLLKWSAVLRTTEAQKPGNKSLSVKQQPAMASARPYKGRVSYAASEYVRTVPAEYSAADYPKDFSYYFYNDENPYKVIGESDTTKANSMAQWFIINPVTYPDGFNLTHLHMLGKKKTGKAIVQIYAGEDDISDESRLYSDTLSGDVFGSDIALKEQFYFAPEKSFWVVVHITRGNTNPLGAGFEQNTLFSTYSYYSSDMGKTWNLLSDALKGGSYNDIAEKLTWAVTAKSGNPHWGRMLTLTPESGMIRPAEVSDIKLLTTGKGMINGTYKLKLALKTNDLKNENIDIPVTVNISGHKPALNTAKIVDFGKIYTGETKKLKIEIYNSGYGSFAGRNGGFLQTANLVSSNPGTFKLPSSAAPLPARAKSAVEVTFTPPSAGTHSATLTLTDQNNIVHKFLVTGSAIAPAKINVTPSAQDVGELAYNGTKTAQLVIKNEGGFPLEYVLPKFSDDTISGAAKNTHKFGYSYISNLNDPSELAYAWKPLLNSTDIKTQFGTYKYWSEPVNIGFSFPFYDGKYNTVYIGSYGALNFTGNPGAMHNTIPPTADRGCIGGMGLITAFGSGELQFDGNSKLLYGKQDGNFVISYEDALAVAFEGERFERVSFRIILCPNGDVEMYYQKYNGDMLVDPKRLFIACADIPAEDPLVITDWDFVNQTKSTLYTKVQDGSAIKIVAPERNMITNVDKPNGIIDINATETITLTLSADSTMYKGTLKNIVTILSNDPSQPGVNAYITANISGDYYKPEFSLSRTALDFGDIFQTAVANNIISVVNSGSADAEITAISLKNGDFTFSPAAPFEVKAGRSIDILITAPTAQTGLIEDVMTVTTAAGTLEATLRANVIQAPDMRIAPAQITQVLESGSTKAVDINITNTGNHALQFAVTPQPSFYPTDNIQHANEEIDYQFSSSIDNKDVAFNWIDIIETGVFNGYDHFSKHDFLAVDLPFGFPFYGKVYNKIYICMSGFITFTEYEDLNNLPGPESPIPSPDHRYHNFIAPYWGNHTPSESKIAGVYYQSTDNEMIVSFVDYNNSTNLGVCFQAIMSKNGKIKYQYTLMEDYGTFWGTFGITGFENEAGSKGAQLADRYIAMESAIEIDPVKTYTLAAGKNQTVNMLINTTNMMAGNYSVKAPVVNNVPTKQDAGIDLELTVSGQANAVYPDALDFGDIIIDDITLAEPRPFEVKNTGTAYFEINGIDYPGMWDGTYMVAHWGVDPWTGNPGWTMFNPDFNGPVQIGKAGMKFAIMVQPPMGVTSVDEEITLMTDLPEGNIVIPIKYSIVGNPEAGVDQKDYSLYAPTEEFRHDSIFTIANTGEYRLDYKVDIVYEKSMTPEAGQAAFARKTAAPVADTLAAETFAAHKAETPKTKAEETPEDKYPVDPVYTQTLSYPWGKEIGVMGSGEKYNSFVASTKFTAPANGFNIAAVQYVGTMGPLTSGIVKAEIRNGSDSYLTSKLVAEAEITVTGPEMIDDTKVKTSLRTIEFKNPVYLNPNETFYIFLHFPVGVPNTLGIAEATEVGVTNRYWAKIVSSWSDLSTLEGKYGPVGFMVRCLEKTQGEPWISIQEDKQGSVEIAGEQKLTVHVNAMQARDVKGNRAKVVISTNDPAAPEHSFRVVLDKNGAPVITATGEKHSVKENENGYIAFTVNDSEGDHYTVTHKDEAGIAALKGDTVILSPKFGQAGNHSVTLTATDEYGYASSKTIEYYVEKVNQKPVVVAPVENMKVKLGDPIDPVVLSDLFKDPDNDQLLYTATSDDESIVRSLVADHILEIVPKAVGEAAITLTATDPSGLSAATTFTVAVANPQNNLQKKQISAYPNPVVYLLHIRCSSDISGEVMMRMYSTDGSLIYAEKTVIEPDVLKTLDMTAYPSGIYILEMESKDNKLSTKVIKQ